MYFSTQHTSKLVGEQPDDDHYKQMKPYSFEGGEEPDYEKLMREENVTDKERAMFNKLFAYDESY